MEPETLSGQEAEFDDTPAGWARRWTMELSAARKRLERWHTQGGRIVARFKDEREGPDSTGSSSSTRWNLYTANVQTQRAMMYGQTPRVSVTRRHADAHDDVARVAAEMLERLLNTDIERDSDGYASALSYALDDRLLAGMGNVRVRYTAQFDDVPEVPARVNETTGAELAPAVPATRRKASEDVEVDYVHWRDQLWSPARTFEEVRWWGFRVQMSRSQLVRRFGAELGKTVPLNGREHGGADSGGPAEKRADPWARADVWEIWSKEHGRVFWYVEGYPVILDVKPDLYGLRGFWPFPRPMFANLTTDALVARPDFVLAQDLYDEIDLVSTRITLLERAIAVKGVYDKSSGSLQRLLQDTGENELIPVDNWALFAEKGGVRGAVDWLPLDQVVSALTALRDYRRELIDALYQVTGMSDILRGQAASSGVTATEQAIKARFGSVRMQALQDEFARFASDVQRLKTQVICRHFEPQTILERSNFRFAGQDLQLALQAVQLLKGGAAQYRIEVKPEAVSLTDFAALRAERTEVLTAIAGFIQSVAPLIAQSPASTPYLLQILQWSIAGLKGASTMEGILDQAIAAAQQAAAAGPQPGTGGAQQPDPKLLATQLKGSQDMQREQFKLQADLTRIAAETQAHAQQEAVQRQENVREAGQKALIQHAARAAGPVLPGGFGAGGSGGLP